MQNDQDQDIIKISKQIGKLEERCNIMAIINASLCLQDVKDRLNEYIKSEKR